MRQFNVKVNGQQYYVEIEEAEANKQPTAAKTEETVEKTEQKSVATTAVPAVTPAPQKISAGATLVKAPMPGLILQLFLQNGASVKKNERIILIEAMKMEHDIVAPMDGTVRYITQKGDNVETGAELAVIE